MDSNTNSAVSSPQNYRNRSLDFVRGVAIFLVMGNHFYTRPVELPLLSPLLEAMRTYGWVGVDLFFVLSGFLVGSLLLKEYGSVLAGTTEKLESGRFLLRRMFKIWPAYYVMVLAHVVVRHSPLSSFLWQNLLNVQNYFGSSIGPTWSLAVEEHFYVLLAAGLAWCATKKIPPRQLLLALFTICGAVLLLRSATWLIWAPEDIWRWTHTRLDSLLFGVILALVFKFWPQHFERIAGSSLILLATVVLIGAFIVIAHENPNTQLLQTIGYTLLYIGAAAFVLLIYRHGERARHLLIYRATAMVGLYSYGIYLWHESVTEPIDKLQAHLGLISTGATIGFLASKYLIAIAIGIIATRLVEWPFLKMRERVVPSVSSPLQFSSPSEDAAHRQGAGQGEAQGGR